MGAQIYTDIISAYSMDVRSVYEANYVWIPVYYLPYFFGIMIRMAGIQVKWW